MLALGHPPRFVTSPSGYTSRYTDRRTLELFMMAAGGLDVGGIEYLEAADGRLIFYDVNANSNLRAPIAREFGFDPFERVVDYLVSFI